MGNDEDECNSFILSKNNNASLRDLKETKVSST